jgi:Fur family iron response transcriptional regulator
MSADETPDQTALRRLGIRPTLQRLAILDLLRRHGDGHVTAQEAFQQARALGLHLTLGTVYNVLNDFARAGLLRRMEIGERTCFCSNRQPHHHYLDEASKRLFDITGSQPVVSAIPEPPPGMEVAGVEVIVRLRPKPKA